MKKIIWEIRYLSPPTVLKYCRKCGRKEEFICSGQFRVNAQRRTLDVWLIYKCANCDTTWNAEIYSRVSPQSLDPQILDGFHNNDEGLAERYAMDIRMLQKNGAEFSLPAYSVLGDVFLLDETVEVELKSKYRFPIKVSSIIREKLHLSQKEYQRMVMDGRIQSVSGQDLTKCRLHAGMCLIFNTNH